MVVLLNTFLVDYSTYFSTAPALYKEIRGQKHREGQMRTTLTGGWTNKQVTGKQEEKRWPKPRQIRQTDNM